MCQVSYVSLHVRLPTSEVLDIEAAGGETTRVLKERVAACTGIDEKGFALMFEGSEIGTEGRLVREWPFEDGSELSLVMSDSRAAEEELRLKGWGNSDVTDIVAWVKSESATDQECKNILQLMKRSGICENKANMAEALWIMSWAGMIRTVEMLVFEGYVNPGIAPEGFHSRTPLHIAASMGRCGVVLMLLSYGCNPDVKDVYGETPLHHAAFNNRLCVVRTLLSHRADPSIQSSCDPDDPSQPGATPHTLAMRNGNTELAVLLQ
eukprot:TRINITY_DN27155_c0_g1_i1.p1 TRINITY_DN27155_c0_g1~~TRINITY_DN27155_c0_g1_i1.p1  ORF type:complete len:283 (+),score=62.51 TRINITY_DN27155_c0_g1_i1:55-849(+)